MEEIIIGKVGYDDSAIREQINNKADKNHTHDELNTLQEQINSKADIGHTHNEFDNLQNQIDNKVDKVSGKGLSTNDYTTAEKNKLAGLNNYDDSDLQSSINTINNKIPTQANSTNQLADKDFVNSSISTATAEFVGTFNSLNELKATTKTYDNNDYAFVIGKDSAGNTQYSRYKWNGSSWVFEYVLNNSSFTSEQWKAINSNVTDEWRQSVNTSISNKVDKVSGKGLSTNDFTTAEKNKLAGLSNYDDSSLRTLISGKSDSSHTHSDLNGLSTRSYFKNDNSGYPTYRLMWDITDFFNTSIVSSTIGNCTTRGFVGFVFSQRENSGYNAVDYHMGYIDMNITYRPIAQCFNLFYTNQYYTPYIIKDTVNSKYYLGLKTTAGGRGYRLFGRHYDGHMYNTTAGTYTGGTSRVDIEVKCTNSSGALPTGYELVTTYNSVDLTPKFKNIWNITEVNKAINDKNGNDITTTYATKTDINGLAVSGHTHSQYHEKSSFNIKNYGSPNGTIRYVELSSAENFAGVEVNIAYSGKWYFSQPGKAPLYLGYDGATYNNYGLTGYAWGTENKKLYLRFAGYRGVSVSVLGAMTNVVSISDWTTTAPTGITFKNDEYDIKAKIDVIDNKANYRATSMVGLGFTKDSYVSVRDFWTKLFSTFGSNGVLHFTWSNANAAYVGDTTSNVYLSGGTLIYTVDRSTTTTWGAFSAIYIQGSGNRIYNIRCSIADNNAAGKETWSIQTIANHSDLSSYAKTTDVSSSINTAMSGILNQVAATLSSYVIKNANNVMGGNGGLDFNTNKATLRLPVYGASDATPTENGAFFIQRVD